MGRSKVFTSEDRKEVLRELVREGEGRKLEEEKEKLFKEKLFIDDCPYCHTTQRFENSGNREAIGSYSYLAIKCPNCGRKVYFRLNVRKSGSALDGITYEPEVGVFTFEGAHHARFIVSTNNKS